MSNERKVFLYIAMSLDGYIAKPDGDLGFLSVAELEGEDYGYAKFTDSVDTVILGRKTYDKVLSMGVELPYPGKEVYVFTRTAKPAAGKLNFYSGELKELVEELKNQDGKNIYCDGGSETIHLLLQDDLIDELIVSIIPVLLGDGIPLFRTGFPEKKLKLIRSESFRSGLVQVHYKRIKS